MESGVSFILHCIMEHQFIFSATYDSQEERKDKIRYFIPIPDRYNPQYKMIFFFSGCFCDILICSRIRPERKYYVTKIICFFQERNRFVNCSDPGASFYVLGQTG